MQEIVPKYETGGTHIIADFYGVENFEGNLDNEDFLKSIVSKAIDISKAQLLSIYTHKFEPQGVTLSAIISESSIDLHTYSEHKYLSISFYTCGDKAKPLDGIKFLKEIFKPEHMNIVSIARGTKESMDFHVIHTL